MVLGFDNVVSERCYCYVSAMQVSRTKNSTKYKQQTFNKTRPSPPQIAPAFEPGVETCRFNASCADVSTEGSLL